MNAPVRHISLDWRSSPPSGRQCLDDRRAMALSAKLAAALLDPLGFAPHADGAFDCLSTKSFEKLAASRHFGRPVRQAVARRRGFASAPIEPAFFDRLTTHASTRLCVLLSSEPIASVRATAIDVAAAILHRRILSVVMKAERTKLRSALGEDALRLGSQESPMMYASLADLAPGHFFDAKMFEDDDSILRKKISSFGMAALLGLVQFCEPDIAALFIRRDESSPFVVTNFSADHREQVVRLIRRRTPAWSAIID